MSRSGQQNHEATGATTSLSTSRKRHHDTAANAYHNPPGNRRKDPKVSRACDACKTRKIRCSGTLPCNNCTRRRLSCAYASKYARGRPPTPPSLGLTPSRGVLPSEPGHEFQSVDGNSSHRADSTFLDAFEPSPIPPGANVECVPQESMHISRASPDLVIEGQYFDPTSGLSFLHRAWSKFQMREREMACYESSEGERGQLLASAGDRPFVNCPDQDYIVTLDNEVIRELLRVYFDTCVVTYRMLHRQTVETWLEAMLQDREQNLPIFHSLGNARCAILLTILAIARFRLLKLRGDSSDIIADSSQQESDGLFCAALRLTDSEAGFPRLESAQARLIQVLYLLQTSRMNKAWYTFGNACQIIASLGLHRRRSRKPPSYTTGELPYLTQQCGKRVFWVAYTIDKYLSVVFGRPRLLYDEEVDQDFPDSVNDEDIVAHGLPDWEPSEECHVDSLIFHAKIAGIIGRLSREVYASDVPNNSARVTSVHRLVEELHTWRASLPPHLGTVKPSTLIPSFRREATALSLAYWHALIHANRPFLLGDRGNWSSAPIVQERTTECIFAAKKALELVNSMAKDTNLFHSFWWMNYVTFCALAVVYVWQIDKSRGNECLNNTEDHGKLFELAETCHTHLLKASSAASPNRRYSIILDELRIEAQRGALGNRRLHAVTTDALDNAASGNGESNAPPSYLAAEGPPKEVEVDNVLGDMPSMLDAWQTTDWLDLDSSAFYPILDACEGP